jgi:hypothetical protein
MTIETSMWILLVLTVLAAVGILAVYQKIKWWWLRRSERVANANPPVVAFEVFNEPWDREEEESARYWES